MRLSIKRGFTLVELLVVIVIIGMLAGLLLPVLSVVRIKAKEKKARLEASQLESALRIYYLDNRGWKGLDATKSSNSTLVNKLNGSSGVPYMEFSGKNLVGGSFVDPFNNAYQIEYCAADNSLSARGKTLYRVCAVWSKGVNGKTDTDGNDDDDDQCSWR